MLRFVHPRASRHRRRSRLFTGVRRWLTIAMVAWLGLVLAGREHVLQAIGIHLACVHPGGTAAESELSVRTHESHAERGDAKYAADAASSTPHDEPIASSHDDGDGDDCPPGCTECACGAAPCAPSMPHILADRLWSFRDWGATPHLAGHSRDATTLERPPRRG